jgi:CubicO group peptidase (beta-lactamase class C family)
MSLFVNQVHDSLAAGSMNCSNRDFAIGSWLMVNDGKNWKGEQVVPKKYIEQIKKGDQRVKDAFPRVSYEHHLASDAFYKNQWRTITDDKTGRTFSTMIGVNGQFSAFDHKTGNVIATFGSYREHTGTAYGQLYLWDILFKLFDELEKQGV